MDGLFYRSALWRWVVRESKKSNVFFLGVSTVCVGGSIAAALGLQALTNPGTVDLGGEHKKGIADSDESERGSQLLRQGRPDAALIGKVNKERLEQMLVEIQKKEDTEDRYAAALRGETLVGPPNARHFASGSSLIAGASRKVP